MSDFSIAKQHKLIARLNSKPEGFYKRLEVWMIKSTFGLHKKELKTKPKSRPLPKAKEKYLEAEETLFQELEEHRIGYRRKFQFESTKIGGSIFIL